MPHATTPHTISTSDGLNLAVYHHSNPDAGAHRPILVAVHGYPDNAGVWNAMLPSLLGDVDVVTYDVRGTGSSDAPAERSGYALSQLVADLDAVVDWAAAHSDGPVHLLAHDWGSIQAWQAVTSTGSSSRVASYTSVSGPCLDHVERWMRRGLRRGSGYTRETFRQMMSSSYILVFKVRGLAEFAGATGILARIMSSATGTAEAAPGFRRRRHDIANGLELYRQNMLTRRSPSRQHVSAATTPGTQRGPRTTDVPVQVITPLQDAYVRPAMAASSTAYVPNVRVTPIDAGHWCIVTDPEDVTTAVVAHIKNT